MKLYVSFHAIVSFAVILLGIVLVGLGWLKVTQQAQYLLIREKDAKAESDAETSPTIE